MLTTIMPLACRWMMTGQLGALSDSTEQAAGLPAWFQRDRRATAYAEAFTLLGVATGDPVLMRLAGLAAGWMQDPMTAGPAADGLILSPAGIMSGLPEIMPVISSRRCRRYQ
jgi:hypothetical protein